ncbi:MAG TPA: 30S ribosomal protein S6 [Longimicrobiaceae bacterium]|nr:30S ribosomal protein S6 [Longimicrobiaceae bacterium]
MAKQHLLRAHRRGAKVQRNGDVRDYETVYIFDSSLEEPAIGEKLDRYHALVAGESGGTITAVDHWGKRQLAYPIEDHESGYYVVAHFNTSAEQLPEFERILRLDEALLRYLVVINEGDLSVTPIEPRPERDDDDDSSDGED